MAKLNAAKRNSLPGKDFAVPGRKYPIENASHARNALARVAQHGSPEQKAEVKQKVHARYPGIKVKSEGNAKASRAKSSRSRKSALRKYA
jgi:hypothetical protein